MEKYAPTVQFINRRYFLKSICALSILTGCGSLSILKGHNEKDLLDVYFLNVGYGDAIFLKNHHSSVLIDGGYSVFTNSLLKFFKILNIQKLNALFITHPHPDHIGGCYGLLASGFPVDLVYSTYPMNRSEMPGGVRALFQKIQTPFHVIRKGDQVDIDTKITFKVLHPDKIGPDMNDSSMVLKLIGYGGLLFTADIGYQIQKYLTVSYGNKLSAKILKAPHHGDYLFGDFLKSINPELVVISVGINPYHVPRNETLKLIKEKIPLFWRTDTMGGLKVCLDAAGNMNLEKCSTWNNLCPLTL